MERVFKTFFVIGLFTIVFLWGASAIQFGVFPAGYLKPSFNKIQSFIDGHPDEPKTSPIQKIASDLGGIPHRYIVKNPGYIEPPKDSLPINISDGQFLLSGYKYKSIPKGYIILGALFNFKGLKNKGIVAFSTETDEYYIWKLPRAIEAIDLNRKRILTQGLGDGTRQHKLCKDLSTVGTKLFPGTTHHSVEIAPDGTYWTHIKDYIIQFDPDKIDPETKFAKTQIKMKYPQIIRKNPVISPLTTRSTPHWNEKADPMKTKPRMKLLDDPWHANDIQPFVDSRFKTSLGYALLISLREQNLIFVLDPTTKKILWYSQGLFERQHDVDYVDGKIYVFDNGMFRGWSRLAGIDFNPSYKKPFGINTIVDGKNYDWFDPSRGQHDTFKYNNSIYHLISSVRKGRALLFDNKGNQLMHIQNYLNSDKEKGVTIERSFFLTEEEFKSLLSDC